MYSEKEFIEAYCWMFYSTKKKAREVYSLRIHDNPECVHQMIAYYKSNCKKAFYED